MATNEILLFAQGVGANVIDQATYDALAARPTGFQAGIAESDQLNKVWRQASLMAYVLAQFIVDQTGDDVLDDATPATIIASLAQAVGQASTVLPDRVVTSSATLNLTLTDCIVALNRTAGVAAQAVNLPNGAVPGQRFCLQDVVGNCFANPLTVTPPAGQISGLANYVCNIDKGTWWFTYHGSNIWGVEASP